MKEFKVGDKVKCVSVTTALGIEVNGLWLNSIYEVKSETNGLFIQLTDKISFRLDKYTECMFELVSEVNPIIQACLDYYGVELYEEFADEYNSICRFTEKYYQYKHGGIWVSIDEVYLNTKITKLPFIPNENSGLIYCLDYLDDDGWSYINTKHEWEYIEMMIKRGVTFYRTVEEVKAKVKELGW